jgi:diaminohydroxyphosphoribosylaminopyrimidine deaminase/5-amino-6-(5-phosphoribosylamino)uracil reductase
MNPTHSDAHWMTMALGLALRGRGAVEPNPMVGCVLVRDGELLAQGYHRRFGGPHAEIDALQQLPDRELARGATAYVTLEPCCHTGKTPPCTRALIEAGLARVVVPIRDPFPRVAGGGLRELEEAGIRVDVGVEADAAQHLLAPYLKRVTRRRPWVIAKWAMTLDGRIATVTGDSQWISGQLSRDEVHRTRAKVDAILVGGGTALADNPTLTPRLPQNVDHAEPDTQELNIDNLDPTMFRRPPLRIVLAGKRIPSVDCNLMRTLDQAPLLIVVPKSATPEPLVPLVTAGAKVFRCYTDDRIGMVNDLLDELGLRQMTYLLVEGGGSVLGSFAAAGEIDETHVYIGPKVVGGHAAPGPVGGNGIEKLAQAPDWQIESVCRFDDDVRVIARKKLAPLPTP